MVVTLGEAIRVLDRRRSHLEEQLDTRNRNRSVDRSVDYIRAERAALDQALTLMQTELVRRYEQAGDRA
jgi:uncharacterized protein YtpQ (UPF0354 family)